MRGTGSDGPRTKTPVPEILTLVQLHRKMAAHFSRRPGAFKRLEEIARGKNVRVLRFVTLAETRVASILTVVQTNLRNWEAIVEYFAEVVAGNKTADADMMELLQTVLTEDVRRKSAEIEAVVYVLSQGAFLFQEEWRELLRVREGPRKACLGSHAFLQFRTNRGGGGCNGIRPQDKSLRVVGGGGQDEREDDMEPVLRQNLERRSCAAGKATVHEGRRY